jgi:hypothetical protein
MIQPSPTDSSALQELSLELPSVSESPSVSVSELPSASGFRPEA